MGWIRVEDNFYDNEKMLAVGCIGRDLYWHGMGFCNRNLTDGLIPRGKAVALVDFTGTAIMVHNFGGVDGQDCAPIAVERLLEAGLWHEDGHDCSSCVQPGPRHYVIHDYLKYQPSKAQVEAKAEANRQRVASWRESQKAQPSDRNNVGNALRTANETQHEHTNPNPNPNLITLGGELTQVGADEPPPICPRHGETNADSPCRACKKRREYTDALDQARQQNELDERRRLKAEREACPKCDDNGMIETFGGLGRCDHMPEMSHA